MNILITGAGSVMGQSIYKALAAENFGEPLSIHFANSIELGAGRYFNKEHAPVVAAPLFPLATDEEYLDHLRTYVKEYAIDIVFAGTQHELAKISTYRDETLRAATISQNLASICMDKVRTAEVLSRYGIRVPMTQTLVDYLETPKMHGGIVVKPNLSSSSRSIFRFENYAKAATAPVSQSDAKMGFLVQERLTGEEFTCGCYVDRYLGEARIICFRRTLTSDGATFYGEIVTDPVIMQYVSNVAVALKNEGLDFGHFNVQLIVDDKGPCLFEINGRLSSTEASKAHFGFNSCAAFVYNIVRQEAYTGWNIATSGKFLRYYDEIYF